MELVNIVRCASMKSHYPQMMTDWHPRLMLWHIASRTVSTLCVEAFLHMILPPKLRLTIEFTVSTIERFGTPARSSRGPVRGRTR